MKPIILKAVLSKKTTDEVKSVLLTPTLARLVFDVYLDTPMQFTEIIEGCFEREFRIEIKE